MAVRRQSLSLQLRRAERVADDLEAVGGFRSWLCK
jgi:hypothetical protein